MLLSSSLLVVVWKWIARAFDIVVVRSLVSPRNNPHCVRFVGGFVNIYMYIHIKPSFFSSLHPFVDKSWPSSGVFSQGLLHCNCCRLSLWLYWHMAILLFQSARRIQCLTSVEPASRRSRNTSLPHFELHSGCVVVGVVVSCWQEIGFHRNWNLWKMYRSSLNSFISPLNDERVALMEQEMQVVWFSYIRGCR